MQRQQQQAPHAPRALLLPPTLPLPCHTLGRADAGLTGRTAKLCTAALTDQLKALARSTARGGLQPYRDSGASTSSGSGGGLGPRPAAGAAAQGQQGSMTPEQLAEQEEMERELEQVRGGLAGGRLTDGQAATRRAGAASALAHQRRSSSTRHHCLL